MPERSFMLDGGDVKEYLLIPTAGNVVTHINAPVDRKYHFLSLVIELVNDATVANRTIQMRITNDPSLVVPIDILFLSPNYAASATGVMALTGMRGVIGATVSPNVYGMWGDNIWLDQLIGLDIRIANGVAGDTYQAWGRYLEYPL